MEKTQNRKGSKKIIIGIVVLAVAVIAFLLAYAMFSEKPVEGAKSITVTVVDNNLDEKKYESNTDAQYLIEALRELEDFSIEGEESEYGFFVQAVNGLTADYEKDGAYWAIYVNDEYANYGVDSQPVEDGDDFMLKYEAMYEE